LSLERGLVFRIIIWSARPVGSLQRHRLARSKQSRGIAETAVRGPGSTGIAPVGLGVPPEPSALLSASRPEPHAGRERCPGRNNPSRSELGGIAPISNELDAAGLHPISEDGIDFDPFLGESLLPRKGIGLEAIRPASAAVNLQGSPRYSSLRTAASDGWAQRVFGKEELTVQPPLDEGRSVHYFMACPFSFNSGGGD